MVFATHAHDARATHAQSGNSRVMAQTILKLSAPNTIYPPRLKYIQAYDGILVV